MPRLNICYTIKQISTDFKELKSHSSNHSGIQLEISSNKITRKYSDVLKLCNILLNKSWIKEEVTNGEEKLNNNESTAYENLCAVEGIFVFPLNSYVKTWIPRVMVFGGGAFGE